MTDAEQAALPRRLPDGIGIHITLFALALLGWWWSVRMASDMSSMSDGGMGMAERMAPMTMSFIAFMVAWLAMMVAMMFPAVAPVVKLYARGAAAGRVAPLPFFLGGYVVVWTAIGAPAYFAWRALLDPIAAGDVWAARLAGGVLVAAGVWQFTPLKSVCLSHCRSPMSVFLHMGTSAERPLGGLRMGVTHGAYCLGCCWALMAVLVAMGTMNIAWMLALAALIMVEKNAPHGERVAIVAGAAFALIGIALIVQPDLLPTLT